MALDVNILVIGFYDRGNAGDEMYKVAIPRVFANHFPVGVSPRYTFKCLDDLVEIPSNPNYECIIFGGGDIINPYFMDWAKLKLHNYVGRVYAFSVGIPYADDARYLHLFDHIYVRSSEEYDLAAAQVGTANVSRIPDAVFALYNPTIIPKNKVVVAPAVVNIGVCLAQPVFYDNPNRAALMSNITDALAALYARYPNVRFHLISFNYQLKNESESDVLLNQELFGLLQAASVPVNMFTGLNDPLLIFNKVRDMNIVLGMRFHSIVFGVICKRHTVPLYCSSKVANFVKDYKTSLFPGYNMPTDSNGRPTIMDGAALLECLDRPMQKLGRNYYLSQFNWRAAYTTMFVQKKLVSLLVKPKPVMSLSSVYAEIKGVFVGHLGVSESTYDAILVATGPLNVGGMSYMEMAQLVCYRITHAIGTPYVWGLHQNMQHADFNLYEAIRYIYFDYFRVVPNFEIEKYYPLMDCVRQVYVHIDPLYMMSDLKLKRYHRYGWPFVVGGITNINAESLGREDDSSRIMIDTYVDRTFHWAHDVLLDAEKIPYRRDWIGFIHHTFDTSHSTYNCVNLFENVAFIESLAHCKGLIALSNYLRDQLRVALDASGFANVPVTTIYHPMAQTDATDKFSIQAFRANTQRKVVQVGTWLRNPYGIYTLPLPTTNTLGLQKCALKTYDSGQYFPPTPTAAFYDNLQEWLYKYDTNDGPMAICGNEVSNFVNRVNKFNKGMYQAVEDAQNSVIVIDRLDDAGYDDLLSKNLIYLKLVDCSAVNTVLECMERNTPVIVNRHPALEEVLGRSYPGFYDNDVHAVTILSDMEKIEVIYNYLRGLNKSKIMLSTFMTQLQSFVRGVAT